ncbi:hypothetical protein CR512_25530 [Pseudomonas putida]|nr:hypothetical protein CR512_25530 [Pseudomonas putida]
MALKRYKGARIPYSVLNPCEGCALDRRQASSYRGCASPKLSANPVGAGLPAMGREAAPLAPISRSNP